LLSLVGDIDNETISEPGHILSRSKPDGYGPALLVGSAEHSLVTEEFHALRGRLEAWCSVDQTRIMLIASALAGEGKSFVAINLAASFASAGHNTLLVETDLRTPSLDAAFRMKDRAGVCAYLRGSVELQNCLCQTRFANLTFMPAGGMVQNAVQLLGSAQMRILLDNVRGSGKYRLVMLDGPEVIGVPEPVILSSFADAVLLVLAANKTPRHLLARTLETLKGTTFLGIVFNRFEPLRSFDKHRNYLSE
jgi:capsular exopolysaccharide synthesis family protein